MGGSTRALPVSPRYRTPHLWPSPRTTAAQAQVLARPAPNLPCRPWACAGADLRVHAPHPRPEQLGLALGSSWAINLRILPTPRVPPLPRPSLDVGRASAWPLPLAPPPPLSGPAPYCDVTCPPVSRAFEFFFLSKCRDRKEQHS